MPRITSSHLIVLYNMSKQLKELMEKDIDYLTRNNKKVRIFLDVRGMFINIHQREGNQILVKAAKNNSPIYSSSVIKILNGWTSFYKQHRLEVEFVLFAEIGDSKYHAKLLNNKYKITRRIERAKDIPQEEKSIASNYIKSELQKLKTTFAGRGMNVTVLLSNELEIDCAPHFIINHITVNQNAYYNYIFTKDKDLVQTLDENTAIIRKVVKGPYEKITAMNADLKMLKLHCNIDRRLFSCALAMIGDAADSVPGIKGCGPKSAANFLNNYTINSEIDIIEQIIEYCSNNTVPKISPRLNCDEGKKEFITSFKCIDFNTIIKENFDYLNNLITEDYMKINNSCTVYDEELQDKIEWIKKRCMVNHKMFDEMSFYFIANNVK